MGKKTVRAPAQRTFSSVQILSQHRFVGANCHCRSPDDGKDFVNSHVFWDVSGFHGPAQIMPQRDLLFHGLHGHVLESQLQFLVGRIKDRAFQERLQSWSHLDVWRLQSLNRLLQFERDSSLEPMIDQDSQPVGIHGVHAMVADCIVSSLQPFRTSIRILGARLFPFPEVIVGSQTGTDLGDQVEIPEFDVASFGNVEGRRRYVPVR